MARHASAFLLIVASICSAIAACSGGNDESEPTTSAMGAPAPSIAPAPAAAHVPDATHGKEVAERFECNRCHEGTGLPEPPPEKQCVGCHEDILASRVKAPPHVLLHWTKRIVHLRTAPSLAGIGTLLEPSWVTHYIESPHEIRPHLHGTMPRLAITPNEASDVTAYLASIAPKASPSDTGALGDIDRGRALFTTKTCSNCHAYTGSGFTKPRSTERRPPRDLMLAPDLRFSRNRVRTDVVVSWIRDPASVKPDTAMPKLPLSEAEARDLAAFVMKAPLDDIKPAAPAVRLPVLDRAVTYDEVEEVVFKNTCWHCHSEPDYARGDGGPGMSGGFGFSARRLNLTSYETVLSGYVDERGERQSLFGRRPGESEPILLESLLAREREERGIASSLRGMPLGLTPLSPEHIQLVETWIAQGHPR